MSIKIEPKMPDCSTKWWDFPANRCENFHPRSIDPESRCKMENEKKNQCADDDDGVTRRPDLCNKSFME